MLVVPEGRCRSWAISCHNCTNCTSCYKAPCGMMVQGISTICGSWPPKRRPNCQRLCWFLTVVGPALPRGSSRATRACKLIAPSSWNLGRTEKCLEIDKLGHKTVHSKDKHITYRHTTANASGFHLSRILCWLVHATFFSLWKKGWTFPAVLPTWPIWVICRPLTVDISSQQKSFVSGQSKSNEPWSSCLAKLIELYLAVSTDRRTTSKKTISFIPFSTSI